MSADNSIALFGLIVTEPVIREVSGNNKVANFNIVVNNPYNKDKTKKDGLFVKLEVWNKTVEFVQNNLSNKDIIYVQGELKPPEAWVDKEGNPRAQSVVTVNQIKGIQVKKWIDKNAEQGGDQEPAPAPKIPDNPRF